MIRLPLLLLGTLILAAVAAIPAARGQSAAVGTVVLQ